MREKVAKLEEYAKEVFGTPEAPVRSVEFFQANVAGLEPGRIRQDIHIRIVIDSKEPEAPKEKSDAEGAAEFIEQYNENVVVAMDRPTTEIQKYLAFISQQCEELGVPVRDRSLKEILHDLKVAKAIRAREREAAADRKEKPE